jgi:small subunit ribosomal protein S21
MIHVTVKEGENIDRALKRYKRKFDKLSTVRKLRAKSQFIKPSIIRRTEVLKAAYVQTLKNKQEE